MKKMLLPLLCLLLCLCASATAFAFGEATPPTGNSTGSSSAEDKSTEKTDSRPDSAQDKPAQDKPAQDKPSEETASSSENQRSEAAVTFPNGQGGATIIDQYEPDAYHKEKTPEEQIIEEALQQYAAPRLASLNVAGLALIPLFSSETFYYSVYVPEELSNVSISASTGAGSIYINGTAGSTRQIPMGSGEQTVHVTVTSQTGSTGYSIVLLRHEQPIENILPVLTHVQIYNDDFFYEQDITTQGGDILINLPQASKKRLNVTLSANIEVLAYCNNIRVYNVVYNTQAGAWQWKRQNVPLEDPIEVFLADTKTKAVQNTYNLILQQPNGLNIQLQVGNDQAMVNDALHTLDTAPVILEGSTMVPLRFIAEALGAQVNWHSEEMRVEMDWQGQKLELFIGRFGENMPQAPFLDNGRTMVPLRYVSESLKCDVEWLAATKEIIITR